VDSLLKAYPEHEFILWTITDDEDKQGQFKYNFPDNVVEVHENFLGTSLDLRIQNNPNLKFSDEQHNAISKMIRCEDPDWSVLRSCFQSTPTKAAEFFISEEYLNILKDVGRELYPFAGFKDLFWTIRSMFLPLLYLIGQPMPEADIYHSPSTGYAGVLAALAAEKYNKPFILTEHGIYTREREEEILRSTWVVQYFKDLWISMFFMFARHTYASADKVTSLYHRASLIQQELGCPPEKCVVVCNGIEIDKFSRVPKKQPNDWIDIAGIVRFAPIKDIKTLIYTFSRLKQELSNVRLHILGGIEDEEYYQECMHLIDFLKVEDIIVPGIVDVVKYLENIDFTVLTSISEGQPFAILESMAARRPVVSTDVGSCRELIEGDEGDLLGHAGICVPPMHQSELLRALLDLCENPATIQKMGDIGYSRIENFFTMEIMIENYRTVYTKVMESWQE
jgi:glycosyltransferase involved in cell wall biosynthesis